MAEVSIRDLRNHGGEVIDRVLRGERLTITRDGRPVAELHGLGRTALPAEVLLKRWAKLPDVDPHKFREDLDALIERRL
jgi:prevent-host-death family protein